MVNISNNFLISMNAGDYFDRPLFINAGCEMCPIRYILEDGDKVYFAIHELNQPFECSIVRKIFTKDNLNAMGDVDVILETSDTEHLMPGTYYYEAKLSTTRNNKEYVDTIVPSRKFTLI